MLLAAAANTHPPSTTFGQLTNPAQPPTSLFGAQAGTAAPPNNLFGGALSSQSNVPAGGFGAASNTPASLFGNDQKSTPVPAAPSPFSFGQQNNSQSNTASGTATPPQPSIFGASTPNAVPAAGSTTPAAKPLFGGFGQTTTPAAPPPGNTGASLFGARPAGASLFGNSGTSTPIAAPPASGGSLFGAKPAETVTPAPTTGLFGAKPATTIGAGPGTPANGASLFGNAAPTIGSTTPGAAPTAAGGLFSFGAKPAEQSGNSSDSSKATSNLFSGTQTASAITDSNKSATPAAASQASTGSLFGGSLFGTKPAVQSGDATKTSGIPAPPAGGFSFGNLGGAKTDKPATPTEPPKTGGFNFASFGAGAEKTASPGPTIAEPPKPPTGGFSFGNTGSKAATPTADKAAPSKTSELPKAPSGGFSFGNFGATKIDKPPAEQAKEPAAPVSTPLVGDKLAEVMSAPPRAPTGFGFGGPPKPAPTAPTAPAASSSAAGPSEPAPNLLRGKTLDDIVIGWNKDLDGQVKEFERQAGEVREWDKVLVRNGNQVSQKSGSQARIIADIGIDHCIT